MATATKRRPATKVAPTPMAIFEKYVLGTAQFVELPVKDLYIDKTYQRDRNEVAVSRIVAGFDLNKYEPPTINDRHAWAGYKGPRWVLIDGQHRKAVAQKLGLGTITCRVVAVSPEHEAQLFVELNRQRIWLTPMQAFKAELAGGNPAAQEIDNCLGERGLYVQTGKSGNGHGVAAVMAMKKIYASSGTVGLGRTIDIARLAWPEDDTRRFSANVLLGIHKFISKNPKVDVARLQERLSTMTSTNLQAKATSRYYAWKSLAVGSYNKGLVDAVAEEIGKVYRKRT